MSLDADVIVDRRRMRRKLTFWRVFAVLIAIVAVIAIASVVARRGSVVTGSAAISMLESVCSTSSMRSAQTSARGTIMNMKVAIMTDIRICIR